MADRIPTQFRKSADVIATYDYIDISEGTGIVQFYGAKVSVDTSLANDKRILTRNAAFLSHPASSESLGESNELSPITSSSDFDWDVTFNLPKIVEGTTFIIMPVSLTVGASTGDLDLKITIKKWDGSTETTLVAETAAPTLTRTGAGTTYGGRVLKLTIPNTKFKAGETLRYTFTCTLNVAGDVSANLYHSPSGADTNHPITGGRFSVFVPFRIKE